VELGSRNEFGSAEQGTKPVNDVRIGADPLLDDVLRVARLALEAQLRLALDVVQNDKVQQYGKRNSDPQDNEWEESLAALRFAPVSLGSLLFSHRVLVL